MDAHQKRALLFLLGCMPARLFICYLAWNNPELLPLLGKLALIPAVGFAVIYAFGLRTSGPEAFGDKIWWNSLRPVHACLWGLFAVLAMQQNPHAWKVLFIDTLLGLVAWAAVRL